MRQWNKRETTGVSHTHTHTDYSDNMEDGVDEEEDSLEDSVNKVVGPQLREHLITGKPEARAPTMTIETVRVGRPIKVLSLLSSVVSLLCFIVSIVSTVWISKGNTRTGLYEECSLSAGNNPEVSTESSCMIVLTTAWDRLVCAVLAPTAVISIVIGIFLFIGGMLTMDVQQKIILYNSVIIVYTLANLAMLTTSIILPIAADRMMTIKEESATDGSRTLTLGWAYILTLCGLGTLVVSIILLLVDRKADEVAYRECVH